MEIRKRRKIRIKEWSRKRMRKTIRKSGRKG